MPRGIRKKQILTFMARHEVIRPIGGANKKPES